MIIPEMKETCGKSAEYEESLDLRGREPPRFSKIPSTKNGQSFVKKELQ
jgi:hypothetical protein